jgi:hypothetical protein
MEGVEDLMKGLKLMEAEKKSVLIGDKAEGGSPGSSLKAFKKLLSDKGLRGG